MKEAHLIKGNLRGIPEFSGCQVHGKNQAVLPDYDCIPNGQGTFEVREIADRCGIPLELGERIYQFHCELFEREKIIFFNPRYTDLATAQRMKQELFSQDAQWCIYGIGFFDPVIKDIPEFRMLPPLSENGIFLGFDLYGFEGNSLCCPFRHCDMKNKIPLKLGIMPNDFGLIANIEGANKLAVPKYLFWSTGLSLLCWIVIAGSMAVSIHFFYHYPDNGFAIVCAYALGWLYIWFFAIPIFTLYALLLSAIFLCKNCMGK